MFVKVGWVIVNYVCRVCAGVAFVYDPCLMDQDLFLGIHSSNYRMNVTASRTVCVTSINLCSFSCTLLNVIQAIIFMIVHSDHINARDDSYYKQIGSTASTIRAEGRLSRVAKCRHFVARTASHVFLR
jgi:hypothetical protein